MKDRLGLLTLLLALLISGCAQRNGNSQYTEDDVKRANIDQAADFAVDGSGMQVIDLSEALTGEKIYEPDYLDTMFFIPLETIPESILSSPVQIIMTDDRIFVLDSKQSILIFDNNGRYVNSLIKGQGPGEINRLMAVAYDYFNQELMVIQNKWIMYYDKNGRAIDKTIKCAYNCMEFAAIDNGFLFFSNFFFNQHLGSKAEKALLLAGKDLNIISKGLDLIEENNVIFCAPNISRYNGQYFVSQIYNDTIFSIGERGDSILKAKYLLTYSDRKVSDLLLADAEGKFYNSGSVMENSTSQIFPFWCVRKGSFYVIRDKTSGHTIGGNTYMYEGAPEFLANTRAQYGDYFVSFFQPFSNMECTSPAVNPESNARLKGLTEEDNPVLILYKLKQF